MSEHEFDRTHSRSSTSEADHDVAPNCKTTSSQLDAPTHPIASGIVWRKARDANGVAEGADGAIANASTSTGFALPETLMRKFEASLGADLSSVRVHTGGESHAAADSVGAKAYTMGQDIHFGAGHYDPSTSAGEHLLAHEVAHTVQQGSSARIQNKLEVSSPVDAAEHEADAAASAMMSGASFAVTMGSGVQRKVFRKDEPKTKLTDGDKKTAINIQHGIADIRASAEPAKKTLAADASAALKSVSATSEIFGNYETLYKAAVIRFSEGIRIAAKERAMLDKAINITADLALKTVGSFGGVAGEAKEMFEGVRKAQEALESVKGIMKKEEGAPPPVPTEPAGTGDWKGLLKALVSTFTTYASVNKELDAIDHTCNTSDTWVSSVANGTLDPVPQDLWNTADGVAAQKLAAAGASMVARLATIKMGLLSAKPIAFEAKTRDALAKKTAEEIEREVGTRWIAGLSPDDGAVTRGAVSYLKKIGLIDANGKGLGVDTGMLGSVFGASAFQQKLILARAKVEQRARELVGRLVYWSYKDGGIINDPEDDTRYAAHGTLDPNGDKNSQRVRITGYKMDRMTQVAAYGAADEGEKDPINAVKSELSFEFAVYKPET